MEGTSTGSIDFHQNAQQHIRGILSDKAAGRDAEGFNQLLLMVTDLKAKAFVSDVGKRNENQEYLRSTVSDFTACVSVLHQQRHTMLLSELLSIPLWDCNQELRDAVLVFMLHLAVVNTGTLQESLQLLVLTLNLPWPLALQQADDDGQEWQPSELVVVVQKDIVKTIDKILEVVPVSGSLVLPILARGLPNKVLSRAMQCTYLRGLLKIIELDRAAPMRGPLLAVVVQHLVSLDVEIRWQDIAFSLDEEDEEEEDRGPGGAHEQEMDIFELEGQTEEELQLDPTRFRGEGRGGERREGEVALERVTGRGGFEGAAAATAAECKPSTSDRPQVDEAAEKLDSMMSQVFNHISNCRREGQLASTWQALLDSFFATVLITHKSKFTQYLLWHILHQDGEARSRSLLERLMSVLKDTRQPPVVRSAAAAYIASFLARAAFLPDGVVVDFTVQLADWCLYYCNAQERGSAPRTRSADELGGAASASPGVVHQVFYAACQGLLYVLCYRLEQLKHNLATSPAMSRLFQQTIPTLLRSRLAPMAVCLPTVVREFNRLMARLDLTDCRGLLPDNAEAVRCQRPLEMFFPFDPYLLRRSASFLDLRKSFVRWKQGHSDAADENEEAKSGDESESTGEESESESDSSGIGSDSDEEGSADDEQLSEAFQDLTPKDSSPVALRSARQMITRKRAAPAYMAASVSTNGTTSPPCPMSWTPNHHLSENLTSHHRSLLKPLDTGE